MTKEYHYFEATVYRCELCNTTNQPANPLQLMHTSHGNTCVCTTCIHTMREIMQRNAFELGITLPRPTQ